MALTGSYDNIIRDRIGAAFSGDIAYLYHSPMQFRRLTQNTRPTASTGNRTAQRAADNDDYRTAISLACSSQSIATIDPSNISHVNKLYTQPVPSRNHPPPPATPPHQPYSLPGDICNTILHAAKNKGAGVNADSIDLFTTLVKSKITTIKHDLHFTFNLIYQNKLPQPIKRYFTDVYLFCLTRTPTTPPNSALSVSQRLSDASLPAMWPVHYATNSRHTSSHITMPWASQTAVILLSKQCNYPLNISSIALNERNNYQHVQQSFST